LLSRKIVLKEIGSKWSKFSEQDLSALKKVTTAQVGMASRRPRLGSTRMPC
jgi:hypothetical protein